MKGTTLTGCPVCVFAAFLLRTARRHRLNSDDFDDETPGVGGIKIQELGASGVFLFSISRNRNGFRCNRGKTASGGNPSTSMVRDEVAGLLWLQEIGARGAFIFSISKVEQLKKPEKGEGFREPSANEVPAIFALPNGGGGYLGRLNPRTPGGVVFILVIFLVES